mgnify:CR=1 FL=1
MSEAEVKRWPANLHCSVFEKRGNGHQATRHKHRKEPFDGVVLGLTPRSMSAEGGCGESERERHGHDPGWTRLGPGVPAGRPGAAVPIHTSTNAKLQVRQSAETVGRKRPGLAAPECLRKAQQQTNSTDVSSDKHSGSAATIHLRVPYMGLPPAMLDEDFRSQTQKPRRHEGVLDGVSSKDRPRTGDGEGEGGSRGVEMLEQHHRMAALVLSTPLTFIWISCSPVGHQRTIFAYLNRARCVHAI